MIRAQSCREWLRINGHIEVAALIDEVMGEWKSAGKRTRRDWWLVLAGNKKGNGRMVAGRVFPVLSEAIQRPTSPAEQHTGTVPGVRVSNRWPPSSSQASEVAD